MRPLWLNKTRLRCKIWRIWLVWDLLLENLQPLCFRPFWPYCDLRHVVLIIDSADVWCSQTTSLWYRSPVIFLLFLLFSHPPSPCWVFFYFYSWVWVPAAALSLGLRHFQFVQMQSSPKLILPARGEMRSSDLRSFTSLWSHSVHFLVSTCLFMSVMLAPSLKLQTLL